MATRVATVLTCNRCKFEAPERFPHERSDHDRDRAIAQWMREHGWAEINGRHLCPTCLMDYDASQRTGIRVGAR